MFRPALKLLARRLCFTSASASWSHQAKSGPLQSDLSNANAVVPVADDRRPPHQTLVFIHPNDMAEPAEPMDINTLSNIHVIAELIQLPVGSDTVDIGNSYWTKNLAQQFSLEHSQGSCIDAWQ